MDKFSSKVGAVKEKIIFGGIIVFIIYILVGIFACFFSADTYGSTFLTFLSTTAMIGVCLFCLLDNLNKIASDNKAARFLAVFSLVAVPFYLIIYLLNAWGAIELTECVSTNTFFSYCSQSVMNFFGKAMVVLGSLMSMGTIGSMTMSIRSFNQKTIEVSKITATVFFIIATGIAVYLTLASDSILSFYGNTAAISYTAILSALAWFSLTVLAFYLSKFGSGFTIAPAKPLNAKVISTTTPAILTAEEADEPEEKESIYPEPINKPASHVEGESLHANPGEPLHELGNEDHPVIGKATTSTEHPDDFETLESQSNEREED